MNLDEPPNERNGYWYEHALLLIDSLRHWTGISLVDGRLLPIEQAKELFFAPFVVLSHDTAPDPTLTYGNRCGLELFEMTWAELRQTSSRLTAEPVHQSERQRLLSAVKEQGYIDDYRGIRISRNGRRFGLDKAIVWNLADSTGTLLGQAATFDRWTFL